MTDDEFSSDDLWSVVVDGEGRHSVWRADRTVPTGWRSTPHRGTRAECLSTIDAIWTDPRPAAWRAAMDRGSTARR